MTAAKRPAATAAPKKAETVTLKTLFEQLAEVQGMPKKRAAAMATGMIDLVTGVLKAGDVGVTATAAVSTCRRPSMAEQAPGAEQTRAGFGD